MTKKIHLTATNFICIMLVLVGLVVLGAEKVKAVASPSYIVTVSDNGVSASLAHATTSPTYMTPGTATSTFQFDSTASMSVVRDTCSVDSMQLFVAFTASSSASQLGISEQVSNNNIDWYTGTPITTLTGTTTASTTYTTITLPAQPACHTRVVFTNVQGTNNGSVYAEVNLKQNSASQ